MILTLLFNLSMDLCQPMSGEEFGPSLNADAIIEMNQQFDYYDGGGLDIAFLGAAQVSRDGSVNVSRMSKSRLTGPGGNRIPSYISATHLIIMLMTTTAVYRLY